MDYFAFLKSEPVFWSPIARPYDPPILLDGAPALINEDFSSAAQTCKNFMNAGVRIITSNLHTGWIGADLFDYTLTDKTLRTLLEQNPKLYYIPRVKLNVPVDWCAANPEDVFVCHNGPRTAQEIKKLVNTPEHDWLGFNAADDFQDNAESNYNKRLARRNVNGKIGLQSFASAKWRKDAETALTNLIRHIENGPYAKQVIGYHVAYGCCGEMIIWGSWDAMDHERRGDYGINARKAFFHWGLKKYGTLEELRRQWNLPDLSEENCVPPEPAQRETGFRTLEEFFRADENGVYLLDYNAFLADVNAGNLEHFAKVVKRETDNKLVGAFYGYMVSPQAAYSGHLHLDRLLDSPYIDFFAAPKGYHRCECGQPGGYQTPAQSIGRKKIWMDELDNHTHLSTGYNSAKNMAETTTVLWREVVKNISNDLNFWWMDLGTGWFDDPQIMAEIKKLYALRKRADLKPHKSICETLYVVDDASILHTPVSYGITTRTLRGNIPCEMRLAGAPIDVFRLSDLGKMDLSQYKVIVFGNTLVFETDRWESIRAKINKTATLVWLYAAGICNPSFGMENIKSLTGFEVKPHTVEQPQAFDGGNIPDDFPQIQVVDNGGITVMDTYENGDIKTASRDTEYGGKVIINTLPDLTAAQFREIMQNAGCNMPAPLGCTVYADNRIIGLFPSTDITGTLILPAHTAYIEHISNVKGCGTKVDYSIPAKGAAVFEYVAD